MDGTGNPTPQFGTAEYVGSPGGDHCQFCHQPIAGTYYRISDAMSCANCAQQMRGQLSKDTPAVYMRALLFGVGAAIAGLILYATFEIVTGIIIGYISLAVGWMVGTAMMKGSKGVGGRRYQIAAVLLTYAAVSMAAIPVWIHYAGKQKQQQAQQQPRPQRSQQEALEQEQRQLESETGQPRKSRPAPQQKLKAEQRPAEQDQLESATRPQIPPPAPKSTRPRMGLGQWLVMAILLGLASPFLEVWHGGVNLGWVIGLVILFVGMNIAAKLTAGRALQIYGPFNDSPRP
jgi:Flp pilus assembly protein TadB